MEKMLVMRFESNKDVEVGSRVGQGHSEESTLLGL